MSDTAAVEPERPKRRSHKGPNIKTGKPPLRVKQTPKTCRTSPRQAALAGRRAEALQFRMQGYDYRTIGKEMKVSASVVHGWVVRALREITLEPATELLKMELSRLDMMISAHFENATNGDVAATAACLQVMDRRAKLLNLYPRDGASLLLTANGEGGPLPQVMVTFHVPEAKPVEPGPYQPEPRPWQRQLAPPAPAPKLRLNEWGDLVDDA